MKKLLIILFSVLLFSAVGVVLFLALFKQGKREAPSIPQQIYFSSPSQQPSAAQEQKVLQDVSTTFHESITDSTSLTITNVVVVDTYALAEWAGENTGGQVVFAYDSISKTWKVILTDGGILEKSSLLKAGVPDDTATQLLKDAQKFY